jgi:TolB protein
MVAFTRYSDLFDGPFGQVYVMNADGSGLRKLTPVQNINYQESSPHRSPDGKRIVFFNRGYGISVINADGTNLHYILGYRGAGATARPAWSPDGTHIVVGTQLDRFFIINADGLEAAQVIQTALSPGAASPYGGWWAWSSR